MTITIFLWSIVAGIIAGLLAEAIMYLVKKYINKNDRQG